MQGKIRHMLLTHKKHGVIQKYIVEAYLLTWKDIHNVVSGGKQVTIQTVFIGYCFSFLTV